MKHRPFVLAFLPLFVTGCGDEARAAADDAPLRTPMASEAVASGATTCEVAAAGMTLPAEVHESSGLARSARDPDLFWTHNDAGNDPELFAVNETGTLVHRVRLTGAALVDWEDIEAAPCGDDNCLYVGDIGDNDSERDRITVYRVVEPTNVAVEAAPAKALHARYPDGPRDAEALFAGPSGTLYVVTKGRRAGISLYRWPDPDGSGRTADLELVRQLLPEPGDERDRVTAATATPDGRWIGIRTYRTLYLYPTAQLLGQGAADSTIVDLDGLGQPQGESLALGDDGSAWLSSEAEGDGRPRWARLQCALTSP